MPFNPDQYLQEKTASSGFNPDAYLQQKTAPIQPPMQLQEATFPRTQNAIDQGQGYGKQVLGAGLDLLSLPGRFLAQSMNDHGPSSEASRQATYRDLADTKGNSLIGNIVRSPATGAGVLALPLSAPMGGLVKGTGILAKMAQGAMAAAPGSVANAITDQGEAATQGQGFSPTKAAVETGEGLALGAILPALSKVMKGTGSKILNSVLRPSIALEQYGFNGKDLSTLGERATQAIWDNGLDAPNLRGIAAKTQATISDLVKQQQGLISDNAMEKIDPYQNIAKTISDIKKNPSTLKAPLTDLEAAKQKLIAELDQLHIMQGIDPSKYAGRRALGALPEAGEAQPGRMNLEQIQEWKQRLGDMANWQGNDYGDALKAVAKLANRNLDAQIDEAAPGIAQINDKLHQVISVKDALIKRLPVEARNNAISTGALWSTLAGGPEGLLAYMSSKSPMVAKGLYRGGEALTKLPIGPAVLGAQKTAQALPILSGEENQ